MTRHFIENVVPYNVVGRNCTWV